MVEASKNFQASEDPQTVTLLTDRCRRCGYGQKWLEASGIPFVAHYLSPAADNTYHHPVIRSAGNNVYSGTAFYKFVTSEWMSPNRMDTAPSTIQEP